MAWVKIDDQFHTHPKVLRAVGQCRSSLTLYLLSLTWAAQHLTDGRVDPDFIALHFRGPEAEKAIAALVDSGLWERNGRGYLIHDYLEFNYSRERILAKRRADAARKQRV